MAILDKIKNKIKKSIDKEITKTKNVSIPVSISTDIKSNKKGIARSLDIMYYNILKSPYITEKTAMMGKDNKYTFKVEKSTNKIDIKRAVESIYNVNVVNVATINTASKNVRLGAHQSRISGFKKAIVTLKEGDKIDIGV
ncbi:MAG: 50S ribosomal protein L23 [Patescibacteria group bacterium]